jgi:hypothetical protein
LLQRNQKKLFLHILIIRGMTFESEYLGELGFLFENNIGDESEDQEGCFSLKLRATVSLSSRSLFGQVDKKNRQVTILHDVRYVIHSCDGG